MWNDMYFSSQKLSNSNITDISDSNMNNLEFNEIWNAERELSVQNPPPSMEEKSQTNTVELYAAPTVSGSSSFLDTETSVERSLERVEVENLEDLIKEEPWPGKDAQNDLNLWGILEGAKEILIETKAFSRKKNSNSLQIQLDLNQHLLDPNTSKLNSKDTLSTSLPEQALSGNNECNTTSELKKYPKTSAIYSRAQSTPACSLTKRNARSKRSRLVKTAEMPKVSSRENKKTETKPTSRKTKAVGLPYLTGRSHKSSKPVEPKRDYCKPWNEKGQLKTKAQYIEIHYEECLPIDNRINKKPRQFTRNHKYGTHYELRVLPGPPKPKETLVKKEKYVFENEYKIFLLDKMFSKM